jgi:hypothetical protein
MCINRERKITYHVTKLSLSGADRTTLFAMITTLAHNKLTMQKAPITIEEDLINLERDSNEEISKLIEQLEAFFEPITAQLEPLINPATDADPDAEAGATASPTKGGKADPKKDAARGQPCATVLHEP